MQFALRGAKVWCKQPHDAVSLVVHVASCPALAGADVSGAAGAVVWDDKLLVLLRDLVVLAKTALGQVGDCYCPRSLLRPIQVAVGVCVCGCVCVAVSVCLCVCGCGCGCGCGYMWLWLWLWAPRRRPRLWLQL